MHVLIAKMYECNDLDEVSWRKLLCAFRNQKKLVVRNSRSINFPFGVIKIVIEIKVRNCRKVESSDSNWNTCVPICQISAVDKYGDTFKDCKRVSKQTFPRIVDILHERQAQWCLPPEKRFACDIKGNYSLLYITIFLVVYQTVTVFLNGQGGGSGVSP